MLKSQIGNCLNHKIENLFYTQCQRVLIVFYSNRIIKVVTILEFRVKNKKKNNENFTRESPISPRYFATHDQKRTTPLYSKQAEAIKIRVRLLQQQ